MAPVIAGVEYVAVETGDSHETYFSQVRRHSPQSPLRTIERLLQCTASPRPGKNPCKYGVNVQYVHVLSRLACHLRSCAGGGVKVTLGHKADGRSFRQAVGQQAGESISHPRRPLRCRLPIYAFSSQFLISSQIQGN
jgi:hypothetical protein